FFENPRALFPVSSAYSAAGLRPLPDEEEPMPSRSFPAGNLSVIEAAPDRTRPFLDGQAFSQRPGPADARFEADSPPAGALVYRTREETIDVLAEVVGAMTEKRFPDRDVFAMRLALEEALVNAVVHGHRGDPGKLVAVHYLVTPELALVEVEDQGPGFDPTDV